MDKYVIAKYVRLSREDLKYDSLSILNQQIMLDKHIDSLDIKNAETLEFVDNGYSGTNFERPAVQELLKLVKCNKVNCIIVKDFSRFGRNSIEVGYFLEKVFPLFHIRFISISDNFDSNDFTGDTGGIEVAFKYLINETYSQDLSKKVKTGKYQKMKSGEFISTICPYGYKKGNNKRFEIDDEAAMVVKMIFNFSAIGKNCSEIMKELYTLRIPTPGEYKKSRGFAIHDVSRSHGVWQRSTVLRILEDERYTGMYIMGKRESREIGSGRGFLKDESEWIKIPNHHPAIVDKELFEKAKSNIYRYKSSKREYKKYPLRGKVFCGSCNHAMYRLPHKIPKFSCEHTKMDSSLVCYGLKITEKELEKAIFEIITKQAEVILGVDNIRNIGILPAMLRKLSEYERQIQQSMEEKQRLYEQHILAKIDDEVYHQRKSVCDAKLVEIKETYSNLTTQTAIMQSDKEKTVELQSVAKKIVGEKSLNHELADALIDRVEIFPNNCIEIVWKRQDFIKI